MEITAAQVKELRERTGSGLMECKKALVETRGDVEAAIDLMRKQGLVKAGKKSGRIAADGRIVMHVAADGKLGAMLEINSETDFVAKGDDFNAFAEQSLQRAVAARAQDVDQLLALPYAAGGEATVDTARKELIAKIGENINLRRLVQYQAKGGIVGGYMHGIRIGVLVELEGGDAALAKDIAMHIAASRPVAVSEQEVSADVIAKEKEIFSAQAAESGKPAEIIEKMVQGRIKKFLAEVTLVGQPFVKDPETTVGKLLEKAKARVVRFQRFEVGEGIEKATTDFAAEVMAQVRGG
ncbi:MAG: elongation factor Ts [Gammaproteobacteria bacterium]|nr:elongation factor Ts [Gammaproteobacteria bacterium]